MFPKHAQLIKLGADHAIKGLVVCNSWDIVHFDQLNGLWQQVLSTVPKGKKRMNGYTLKIFRERKIKQIDMDTYRVVWLQKMKQIQQNYVYVYYNPCSKANYTLKLENECDDSR